MKPFGKYQLVRRIAAGGMAEVYLATGPNPRSAELIALKLILPHIAEDESFMGMFLQEAKLTAPLIHPNLVQVFDLGMTDGRLYLAMEYIPGRSLNEVMEKTRGGDNPFTVALAAAAVRQASLGLHHAHEARDAEGQDLGLIHRDVSPHNLMLDETGTIKVVDFGVAKATSQSEVSRAGTLKGKVGFMSPEQLKSKPLDRRVDIFALGVVLYEMATGRALFSGRNDAEVLQRMLFEPPPDLTRQGLPPAVAGIIAKAIDRDRSKRYATAEELAEALAGYVGQQLPGTQKQLAAVIRSLFPRAPRTVTEAEAEISASGRKYAGGNAVLMSNAGRVRESTPTDPEQLSARRREASGNAAREGARPRSGERPLARPPVRTGPTDPGRGGRLEPAEAETHGEGFKVDLPAPPRTDMEAELPTTVGRPLSGPRAAPPTQTRPAWEEEDLTVSTVSDTVRPLARRSAPARQRRVIVGVAVAGGVILALAVLLWKIISTGEETAQVPMQVGLAASLDSGSATVAPPVVDAGSTAVAPRPPPPDALPPGEPASPPHGLLTLRLPAGIKVAIDGHDPVMTPVQDLSLSVGHHKLLVSDGRHKWRGDVLIVDGLTAEPKIKLR